MANNIRTKPRVLFFVPQFPVLTETFIASEASKLVEFGNMDLRVFALAKGSGHLPDNLVGRVVYARLTAKSLILSILHFLKTPSLLVSAFRLIQGTDRIPLFFSLRSTPFVRKNGLKSIVTNSRFIHYLKGIGYASLFSEFEPDHIHAHFLSDTSTIVMVAAHLLDVPFSVSAHAKDVFVEGTLIPKKALASKFISVCNGNTWKKVVDLANQTKSSRNVRLIFHGVESSSNSSGAAKTHPGVPFVFTIARLVEKKGLKYLIDASRLLKDKGVLHSIKIAWPGPMYDELISYIKNLDVVDTVEILGGGNGLPHSDILGYINVADIFVLPFIETSSGDVDGVPYSVIEIAKAKKPIIATDAGSMSDMVTPTTGIVVKQCSAQQIADAIDKLINDKVFANTLAEGANKRALELFDINKNVKEIESLILN